MREEKNAVISDRIEREIVIEAPPEVIWGVVTEPDQMRRWLCDTADFEVQPGAYGSVAWEDHGAFDLRIEKAEPPRVFAFRWCYPADAEPNETNSPLVELTLAEDDGATRLRLVESGFRTVHGGDEEGSAAYIADHERGWNTYLAQLRDYVADKPRVVAP
jgi:uncharacterized protein YndB with AHSA1/START domain